MQLCTKKVVMALVMVGVLVQSANAAEAARQAAHFPGTSISMAEMSVDMQKKMMEARSKPIAQIQHEQAVAARRAAEESQQQLQMLLNRLLRVPTSPAAR